MFENTPLGLSLDQNRWKKNKRKITITGWLDNVENDLRIIEVRRWRAVAQDRPDEEDCEKILVCNRLWCLRRDEHCAVQ
ncbi:hypothetical protein TNCV_1063731 [Trichonephila clavipes]|nr:hypothetical protein TNCV_1063731 [Trichonephila clavipes]